MFIQYITVYTMAGQRLRDLYSNIYSKVQDKNEDVVHSPVHLFFMDVFSRDFSSSKSDCHTPDDATITVYTPRGRETQRFITVRDAEARDTEDV